MNLLTLLFSLIFCNVSFADFSGLGAFGTGSYPAQIDGSIYIRTSSQLPLYVLGNSPGYSEINIQNINTSAGVSSDIVATANNGTETTRYVDFGINGLAGGSTPFTGSNEAYMYSSDSTLNIGGAGANSTLTFSTGGTSASPIQRMVISSSGSVGINMMSPSFSLDVAGSIRSSNSVEVDNGIYVGGTFPVISGNTVCYSTAGKFFYVKSTCP